MTKDEQRPTDQSRNTFDSILLIQLLQSLNNNMETIKGLTQSNNSTMALMIENMIGLRDEIKEWEKETVATRAWRNDLEIKALEAKDDEYKKDMEKIKKSQAAAQKALDAIKAGKGQSTERMKAIAEGVLSEEKIDLRGIKLPRSTFTYVLLAAVVLIALLIFMLPDTVSQILIRLAGVIGGQPAP